MARTPVKSPRSRSRSRGRSRTSPRGQPTRTPSPRKSPRRGNHTAYSIEHEHASRQDEMESMRRSRGTWNSPIASKTRRRKPYKDKKGGMFTRRILDGFLFLAVFFSVSIVLYFAYLGHQSMSSDATPMKTRTTKNLHPPMGWSQQRTAPEGLEESSVDNPWRKIKSFASKLKKRGQKKK